MKKGMWIGLGICAALLVLLFVWANRAEQPRSEAEIVRELVGSYRVSPTLSGDNNQRLLEELAEISPEKGRQWEEILDFWAASSEEMTVNENVLPDGLADSNALCIIVLGYQLNADGTMRDELVGRLRAALKSAEKYPNAYILCTGGGTASASSATEAEAMADWLAENGISPERILIEADSLTTSQNAIFCGQLLAEQHPEVTQAALISSDYHLPWASVLFQTEFLLSGQDITLISNAAYPTTATLTGATLLRYQASGILEIAQEHWE